MNLCQAILGSDFFAPLGVSAISLCRCRAGTHPAWLNIAGEPYRAHVRTQSLALLMTWLNAAEWKASGNFQGGSAWGYVGAAGARRGLNYIQTPRKGQ